MEDTHRRKLEIRVEEYGSSAAAEKECRQAIYALVCMGIAAIVPFKPRAGCQAKRKQRPQAMRMLRGCYKLPAAGAVLLRQWQPSIEELLEKLMGSIGEVSGMLTARKVFDSYNEFDDEAKLAFFENLEQNYNANEVAVKLAFEMYSEAATSSNLNRLARAAEPRRLQLLRRLNQTPGATHDLVSMRTDLLKLIKDNPHLKSVDENFVRLFTSWFGRGFLVLHTIDWSTSAAILERIIRYEAVQEIKDWDDLRSHIDPPNRRRFAFFHPALTDEPLIFVEVALSQHSASDDFLGRRHPLPMPSCPSAAQAPS